MIAFAAVRWSSVCRLKCAVNGGELERTTRDAVNCNHNCNQGEASRWRRWIAELTIGMQLGPQNGHLQGAEPTTGLREALPKPSGMHAQ